MESLWTLLLFKQDEKALRSEILGPSEAENKESSGQARLFRGYKNYLWGLNHYSINSTKYHSCNGPSYSLVINSSELGDCNCNCSCNSN